MLDKRAASIRVLRRGCGDRGISRRPGGRVRVERRRLRVGQLYGSQQPRRSARPACRLWLVGALFRAPRSRNFLGTSSLRNIVPCSGDLRASNRDALSDGKHGTGGRLGSSSRLEHLVGAPLPISLAIHAALAIVVLYVLVRAKRTLAATTLRFVRLVLAIGRPLPAAPLPGAIGRTRLAFKERYFAFCAIGERAPPRVTL